MLIPRSISFCISFTARVWSRLARARDPRARLRPVAGPGITVVARPAELLGLGVIADGPGALGATPGLKIGGGGCGTTIAGAIGRLVTPAGSPAEGSESAGARAAASSATSSFPRIGASVSGG
jgi:hypothetical protein